MSRKKVDERRTENINALTEMIFQLKQESHPLKRHGINAIS